jgi:hypothetical protein
MEKFTKKPEKPSDSKPDADAKEVTFPNLRNVGSNLDLTGRKKTDKATDLSSGTDTGEATPVTSLPDDLDVGGDLDLSKKKENPED